MFALSTTGSFHGHAGGNSYFTAGADGNRIRQPIVARQRVHAAKGSMLNPGRASFIIYL
jgi:hypothetical protein